MQLSCKSFVFYETFLKVGYGQHYFDILSQLAGERPVRSGDSPIKVPGRGWVAGVSPRYVVISLNLIKRKTKCIIFIRMI
jgi:hypothetical protein